MKRRRVSIGLILAVVFALSILGLGGSLLFYLGRLAESAATDAVTEKGRLLLKMSTNTVSGSLSQTVQVAEATAKMVEHFREPDGSLRRLEGPMRALYQTDAPLGMLSFTRTDGSGLTLVGRPDQPQVRYHEADRPPREGTERDVPEPPRAASQVTQGAWIEPADANAPLISEFEYAHPVIRQGETIGMVRVGFNPLLLSRLLHDLTVSESQQSFVLLGRHAVVAHANLTDWRPDQGPLTPLPTIDAIDDDALAAIWTATPDRIAQIGGLPGHVDHVPGSRVMVSYLYEEVPRAGAPPLLVGSYFPANIFGAALDAVDGALVITAGALAAMVAIAILLGRLLARPISRLAQAARLIGDLDLDPAAQPKRSMFREIDDALSAFDSAATGLRAFARYVPKDLVKQLARPGAVGAVALESRQVTILMTDIAGYTAIAESLGPEKTAALLNDHFDLLARCVEAEGGTVDKYIGDALMAFWGAPLWQPDHADRASRAMQAIVKALRDDNKTRETPVRMRAGLDTGEVVVGNIGASTRTSYTVIGDAVNLASRLESLSKKVDPDADVIALTSQTMVDHVTDPSSWRPVGEYPIRGRTEPTFVYRLADPAISQQIQETPAIPQLGPQA